MEAPSGHQRASNGLFLHKGTLIESGSWRHQNSLFAVLLAEWLSHIVVQGFKSL